MSLDPTDDPKQGCVWTLTGESSDALRAFGKMPNLTDWLPGDVLLVSNVEPDWVTRQIISVQSTRFSRHHAQWQHAAIYMGNEFVAEATTRGVKYTPIDHYVGKYRLRLRRNMALTNDQRWLVAIEAGVRMRTAYRFSDIVTIYLQSFPGWSRRIRPSVLVQANTVICSQLCLEAHAKVTRRLIVSYSGSPTTPAALSQSDLLADVPLHWCSIL
jgi:hypothetical protein